MDCRDIENTIGHWYSSLDERRMICTINMWDDDGCEMEEKFPVKFKVCETCNGRGEHVNPSIDAHGISADEDPDFADAYFSGQYNDQCYRCGGNRVEPEIEEDKLPQDQKNKLQAYFEHRSELIREINYQQKLGF